MERLLLMFVNHRMRERERMNPGLGAQTAQVTFWSNGVLVVGLLMGTLPALDTSPRPTMVRAKNCSFRGEESIPRQHQIPESNSCGEDAAGVIVNRTEKLQKLGCGHSTRSQALFISPHLLRQDSCVEPCGAGQFRGGGREFLQR